MNFGQTISILITLCVIILYVAYKVYKRCQHKSTFFPKLGYKSANLEQGANHLKNPIQQNNFLPVENNNQAQIEIIPQCKEQVLPHLDQQLKQQSPEQFMENKQFQFIEQSTSILESNVQNQDNHQSIKRIDPNPILTPIKQYEKQTESRQVIILIDPQESDNHQSIKKLTPILTPIKEHENQIESSQEIIIIEPQESEKISLIKQNIKPKEQLDLLIRNTQNLNRCQTDPNCEFVWIHDPNSFEGQIYCPLCDEYDNLTLKIDSNQSNDSSLLSLTVECVYCSLQMGGHYLVSCGCTYHEECLQKIIGLSSGLPSIKCVHCTKKIHKGLIKSRLLNEEQKNQLFDNQLAIIKQGNYCKSGYFKCKNCGELYNQDQCRCQSINLL